MSTERKVGSDIDIAQAAKMEHINDIAAKLNIGVDDLEQHQTWQDCALTSLRRATAKLCATVKLSARGSYTYSCWRR